MDNSIKPSTPDPSAGEWQLALWPADWGGWSRATALLAGVPATVLAALWTPSAVWGLPEPDQSRYPELSFTGALVGHSSDVAAQTCPRYENEPDIREGDILALRIERTAGQWPYEQTIPVDFEILTGSTADAADLGNRKTLQKVPLRFRSAEGFKAIQCHHVDIAKDLKLEGEELLSLRLKPKLGSYRVKSGADRRTISIAEEGAGILVRYGDETLGSVSSQRDFTVRLEAGALPSSLPTGGRSCSLQVDTSFSRTIDMDWRVRPGKDPKYGAASLADFTLPSRVTFRNGVAEIKVSAKMDGDTVAEDFKLDRLPQGQEYPALLNLCEPASVSVPSGVLSAAVFGVIAPAAVAPSKPTGLGATASEDQVNLAWTQSDDGTITGWRYRLRIKGASSWGSAVDMDSSTSSTKSHTVNTSSHFDGIVTEFQVQSYNEVGASPWSEAATATVLKFNNDNPILSISKQGVTVKEGKTETWTVKLNGALAGTVRLSEAERTHAGAIRLSPAALTFTTGNYNQPQTVTVTGVDAGSEVFNGKRTGEVVVNHAFFIPAGSSTPTVAKGGTVEVMVIGEPVKIPAAPQRFRARPGNGQVSLEWADPENGSITRYEVRQRLAGNGGAWGGWSQIAGSGAETVSHGVSGLTNGQKYIFQVRAVNEAGEGKSSQKGSTPMGALTVAVEDGRIVEGDDGKKEMEFKVTLSGETVHDVKLQATATTGPGSTATETGAGRDFVPLSQAVVFSAYGRQHGRRTDMNDLVQTVRVEVVGDHLAEGDETFLLRLDNLESEDKRVALDGGGEKTSATGVIGDDDASPVLAALADVSVTAGQEVAITASATDADGDTVSYTWSRKAGEATPPLPQGTALNQAKLAFTPTAVGVYTMRVTADDGHGNSATEEVTITVGAPATVSVPATLQVTEGTDSNAVVRITASKAFAETVTFNVSYGGTATAEVDYDAVGTVTFNATDTSKDITIPLTDDNLDEDNETMTVSVTPAAALPGGFELGNATTTVTVADDDASPVLAALADVAVTAGQEVAITASATDADGDTVSYAWSRKAGETTPALPQGTVLNQAGLRFTPTAAGTYTMTVTADDGYGNSATEEVTVTVSAPVISAPAKPTGFKAFPSSRQVTLTWDNPGNANISKWQVQQKTGSNNYGGWVDISGSGAATTSHTVTGLTNGTLYGFKIRAVVGTVEGTASEEVSATPELATVSVPATLQVTEGTDSNAVVRITASKAFAETVTFNVSYGGTAKADVDYDAVGTITFNATDTSKDITIPLTDDNLDEDNETLTVSVTPAAALPSGFELGNATTTMTITDDDASPVLADMAPVSVGRFETVDITASATDADGDSLSYSWSRADATRSASNYYCYLYVPDGEGWSFTDLSSSRLTFASAQAGSCNMRVTVDDGHSNTDSKTVVITVGAPVVSAPAQPTGFKASPDSRQVSLSWDNPGNASITKYQIQKKEGEGVYGSWEDISGSGATTTSHTVTGLSNGTAYEFKIRAVNGAGAGEESKGVKATPEGELIVSVHHDPLPPPYSPYVAAVAEGDEGQTEMVFTVELSGSPSHEVRLQVTAREFRNSNPIKHKATGSEGEGRDFVPLSQSIVFPAGARGDALRQEVRVTVLGDRLAEEREEFVLFLNNLETKDKRVVFDPIVVVPIFITDDDASPVLASLADVAVTAGQEVDITASATDADGDTISYAWSRKAGETTPPLPQGTALNQARLRFTPTAAGVYTMTVTADDGYGNSATQEVTVTVGIPATVSVPATLQVTEGTDSNAVVRITASKAFAEAVTFNVSYGGTATAEVDYDDAVGSVTFNATETSKDITIPLTDDNLDEDNETMTVRVTPAAALPGGFELENAETTVTITDDDASPVLASLADVTVTAGQEVDITASATDADGDTISYTWSRKAGETTPPLPQGTALNQARLRFTPTAAGVYTMTVTADDGHGNTASEEVTVTVGAPATVSVPATLQVTEGTDTNAVVRVTTSKAFAETVTFNVSYGGTAKADVWTTTTQWVPSPSTPRTPARTSPSRSRTTTWTRTTRPSR